MGNYDWVENVVVKRLSSRALVLISRFARILKQINGDVLSLQDPQLTKKLVFAVQKTRDSRLEQIFDELLVEFYEFSESKAGREFNLQSARASKNSVTSNTDSNGAVYRGVQH